MLEPPHMAAAATPTISLETAKVTSSKIGGDVDGNANGGAISKSNVASDVANEIERSAFWLMTFPKRRGVGNIITAAQTLFRAFAPSLGL
jgi:hypothetical protein